MKKIVFTTIVLFCSLSAFSQRYTTQTYDDPVSAYSHLPNVSAADVMRIKQQRYDYNFNIISEKVSRINKIIEYLLENYNLNDAQVKYIQNYINELKTLKQYDLSSQKVAQSWYDYLHSIDKELISWTE